ncbi:RNA pol II accessory factor, Cdc73 family-domain-containing protein [Chytridium lagenaria]|nr:RNA pol II accessory factor, Cdc73 family-domain-containing protein [Chytridium lagenaria]
MTVSDLPVTLLRKATIAGADLIPHREDGSPSTDLGDTHSILLSGHRLQVTVPSGYKEYHLLTLLYFLENRTLEQAAYLQKSLAFWGALRKEVPTVSTVDRRDLLEYLTGGSEESAWLKSVEASAQFDRGLTGANGAGDAMEVDGSAGKRSGDEISPEAKRQRLEVEKDFEAVRRIQEKEKTLINVRNFLSIKTSKDFSLALKYSGEFLRPPKSSSKPSSSSQPSSSSKPPPSSSSRPPHPSQAPRSSRPGEKPSSSSRPTTDRPPSSRPTDSSRGRPSSQPVRIPIIMVPAAAQATITLHNVKSLLIDYVYKPTEEYLTRGDSKPPMVVLERKSTAQPMQGPKTFHVYDSIDKLKPEDWDRVCAVFATGQEWQFKNWKYGAPVNIFAKVKGYAWKFQDEPPNEKVKNWNVTMLEIHRVRRHLDAQTVNDFWLSLDNWIREKKGGRFMN